MSSRIKGLVKWYNESKGFGFISPLDGSKDISVHCSALRGDNFNTLFDSIEMTRALLPPTSPCAINNDL